MKANQQMEVGETGLRMNEGLKLEWKHIDMANRMLSAPGTMTKSGKNRYIPLSDSAVGFLRLNPRIVGNSSVFVRMTTGRTLRAPRKEFEEGKTAAKLEWVRGFHDLRHFRATQWLIEGKTLPEVMKLLGHRDIQTTMIYAHFDRNSLEQRMLQKSVGNVIGNVNRW